uniref:protein-tyrosine-phosphatase n=1 Tax=Amphiprion ocellaris TaxID=80972 RepID=A0A3Q1AWF7_AMPOC
MKLRSGVSLWTLLVFTALLKNARAECDPERNCTADSSLRKTETTITLETEPNCNLSTGNISGNGSITGLTPGAIYQISFHCLNCCKEVTTKPEKVNNLEVIGVSTSSISLNWTKPVGNSSSYRVQWTDGTETKNDTATEEYINITNLTAGVQYTMTVTAVADDNITEGTSVNVSQYTKPGEIENLTMSTNTTAISLNWTKPPGQVFDYKVEWDNGGTPMIRFTSNETFAMLSDLIPGTNYTITITAVAGDNKTEGDGHTFSSFTKPEVVRNLTVTDYTTSSISVNWTKPEGSSSFYSVQWTDGNVTEADNVTETHKNITNLTPGVQYTITVTAVAGDGHTEGQNSTVSHYTKPGTIQNLTVSTNATSISLSWTPPPGQVFDYKVELDNGTPRFTSNKAFAVLSDLIPGTNYTITITAVAGDNKTEGEPFTFTSITEPAVVKDLTITSVTTSSVSLNWTKPEGNADQYKILWSTGENGFNGTTTETSFTIRDLNPGFQYNITVAAAVGDPPKEGEGTLITTFTRPEKPENISVAAGTDNLIITWTLPRGRVDHYVVNISNTNLTYSNFTQTADTTASFTDLYPGRIFAITVTAVAGNYDNLSNSSSFATVPTPPGSIILSQPTVSSLHVEWTIPAGMDGAPDISYHITYQGNGGEIQRKDSTDTNTELSPLSSGTSYNVTVQTVGPQNLTSTIVHNSAFTLPNPVLNLEARHKNTTSITVTWTDPQGAQPYYTYLVQTYSETGALVDSKNISDNFADLTDLEPGSRYNVNVTTIAAPGSESTVEQTFSYTMPKAVTNLTADAVNTMAIRLTWIRQSDHKPSYSYLVEVLQEGVVLYNDSTANETYTFYPLDPGNFYMFYVYTVVAGVKSARETTQSYTMPEPVYNLTAIGSTTNLSVSWTPGSGKVSSYSVLLYRDSQLVRNTTDLSNTTQNELFMDLRPGVLYFVTVVTKSGPLESTSNVSNATFPNPPGPITAMSQTVTSITFTWPLPVDMDRNQYSFKVSSANVLASIQNNWFLLGNLSSGSPHSISVVTVGVRVYESTAVTAENYTRPYSVTNLTQTQITTDAVTLVWEQPEIRSDYMYLVQVSNGSFDIVSKTESVTNTTIPELRSGSNFSFTVTTLTADGTEADPVTVSYFTRPFSISGLVAEALNTTAINLTWMKPLEYRDDYKYWVETTGCNSKNTTHAEEMAVISGLLPGTKCTFCVSVMAANGIGGEENCTSQYTRPEPGQPSISSNGSNSSVLVSWTKPAGNVEFYKVDLNSTQGFLDGPVQLNSTDTFHRFENLSAGTLYSAVLITCSGPFCASSEYVTNATYPNPPGPIEIMEKTTSSIEFSWGEAPRMSGASFHYQVTNKPSQGGGNITINTTTATNHTFASLPSGTSFNISVVTVGVLGFESGRVYSDMVTTRPLSAQRLEVTAGEVNITVSWTRPGEYKESYRYNVTWQRSDGSNSNSTIVQQTEVTINNLDPGSSYDISVTTETSDGTSGAPATISTCTKAGPVIDLTCIGPNTANAEVILHWTKPNGQNSGFQIQVNDGEIIHMNGTCCNHTVSNLRHNTGYNLTVETQSCGEPSKPVTVSCKTGITNPPRPNSCEPLEVTKEHDRFSFKIDPSMLVNSNGPIKYIGVLVTSSAPDNADLKEYLGKTYDEWKDEKTPVYLATAINNTARLQSNEDLIVIGDGSKWNGYRNGALNVNGKYQYAIAIFTALELQQDLVDISNSLVSITDFCSVGELPIDPAVIGIAVGATLGIFCILFFVLIGFIIYWKRVSKKETSDIQIQSMRSVQVRVEDYEAYYKKQKADSNCGFAEEFEDLKIVGTSQAKIQALTLDNKPKNRYNNVLPYDSSRVKLSIIHGSPYDDYINANYMPGYLSRKEFIAAQGPLPTTVNEFWRMIWEKNVQTLVMLTRCNEQGRVKCEQYWSSGTKHFENITVKTTSEIPLEDWTIRDFDIKNVKTAETRSIRHFHFTAWPDHGVPETTELLISFRHLVREHMNQYSRHSPTVVHCSAGVGRTGTFIAIDRLIFQIERENIVDVFGIVHDLRMHRPLMVQTEDQYVFLNQCALDVIRSRTGTNVDLIYQNTAALSIYENVEPKKRYSKNGYHNA